MPRLHLPSGARLAALVAATAALLAPTAALAHPLGNFTINHYAGIRVAPGEIQLDVVLDRAEIPTFEERRRLDADGDGAVSEKEAASARESECRTVAASLELTVDGERLELGLIAAGLSFPPGSAGLSTMRLVCGFTGTPPSGLGAGRTITFADRSFQDRLGWREIVLEGDAVAIESQETLSVSPSRRLTDYPEEMLASPLAMTEVSFRAVPGGPPLPPFNQPDAEPLAGWPEAVETDAVTPGPASVPGGSSDLPAVLHPADASPAAVLLAVGAAMALGAGHALTPGHGKTLVAAYLVGTRATPLQAASLGIAVTVAHTLGIVTLAVLVVAARDILPADAIVRWVPLAAALAIVAIGASMLIRVARGGPVDDHPPAAGRAGTVGWRSLFALGLAGGLIPSTSALLILLAAIAAGRAAFGLVLVVAFGLGMALVLGGLGVALVRARGWLDRRLEMTGLRRAGSWAPLVAAVVVLALGAWLTAQALLGRPAL
ncbi:MAG: hypothetical protein H0V87_10640 [Chloroflexi bacterium]|nr:hypothetical protein [Chloroflexota bacterium]